MFATETQILVSATPEDAKQYAKAWGDLGLSVDSFTSDSKKLVIVVGFGAATNVALATEFTPTQAKTTSKKEATNG